MNVSLGDLEVYRISKELSKKGWLVYTRIKKEFKYVIGEQFIRSLDSIGANIAEGYGRFHYLDSVKFYYNARGSLWESKHWVGLMNERGMITEEEFYQLSSQLEALGIKLNNFISAVKNRAQNNV